MPRLVQPGVDLADLREGGVEAPGDGGAGADRIHARRHDAVNAGNGNDAITYINPSAPKVACGPGTDRLVFRDTTMAIWGAKVSGCEHVVLCPRGGTCRPWDPDMDQSAVLGHRDAN